LTRRGTGWCGIRSFSWLSAPLNRQCTPAPSRDPVPRKKDAHDIHELQSNLSLLELRLGGARQIAGRRRCRIDSLAPILPDAGFIPVVSLLPPPCLSLGPSSSVPSGLDGRTGHVRRTATRFELFRHPAASTPYAADDVQQWIEQWSRCGCTLPSRQLL
jgi:hypothetical protein